MNDAPVAQDGTASGEEESVVNGQVVAADVDDRLLAYRLVGTNGGAAHGAVTLNSDGTFTYMPRAGFVGSDSFSFRASDGQVDSNTATIALTVNAVNHAPVIASNGGAAAAVVAVAENARAVSSVTATDPDDDTITYAITGGADAAHFRIVAATGALSFVAAPDFEAPADADGDNGYVVQVRASDGTLFDTQTITVDVADAAGFRIEDSADLNGNGRDDLMWRGEDGEILLWDVNGTQVQERSLGNLDLIWSVEGLGDFDGNGSSEIVRRHANGELVLDGMSRGILDNVWSIQGIGDFNGDGRDEFVYRHANGELLVDGVSRGILDNVWTIAGTGDFDGDGRDELVYRHLNGELVVGGVSRGILDNVWSIDAIGDFNGDGRDEFAYRHANGELVVGGVSRGILDHVWTIETIGDFNNDGRDEFLYRHLSGEVQIEGVSLGNLAVL